MLALREAPFMPKSPSKPLLTLVIDRLLLRRIDDYRFAHRFASRAAAIKWLLTWALDQNPEPPASAFD